MVSTGWFSLFPEGCKREKEAGGGGGMGGRQRVRQATGAPYHRLTWFLVSIALSLATSLSLPASRYTPAREIRSKHVQKMIHNNKTRAMPDARGHAPSRFSKRNVQQAMWILLCMCGLSVHQLCAYMRQMRPCCRTVWLPQPR